MRYAHPSKRQTPKATTVWRLDLSLEKFRVASSGGRKRRGGIWASVRLTILFGPALKNSKTRRMRFANLFSALLESKMLGEQRQRTNLAFLTCLLLSGTGHGFLLNNVHSKTVSHRLRFGLFQDFHPTSKKEFSQCGCTYNGHSRRPGMLHSRAEAQNYFEANINIQAESIPRSYNTENFNPQRLGSTVEERRRASIPTSKACGIKLVLAGKVR